VSSSRATLLASIIGLPLGFVITLTSFPGKRLTITCLNTLLALPTVGKITCCETLVRNSEQMLLPLRSQLVLVDQTPILLTYMTGMEKPLFRPEDKEIEMALLFPTEQGHGRGKPCQ